ncbi:alpha/beta hydrolase [Phaeobacter sp. HF9A]|uniref:alpha/beta hydrolase n=1 Tax=Phaeobacter sp. HF9A TaxID=2721561 RepID=UPI001431464B|nr:alpha/beta hydrolase-fold protein [Phaeobacter sp. HF9A]NIZ12301.1 alpha/beta hydrolase [Phaeobacter sp. HF9A]
MTPPPLCAEGTAWTGARWYDLRDTETGDIRRVFIWVPPGEPPEQGWPVLYMTDGNAVIGTAIDAMRAQACYPAGTNTGWGVLVAVGYPTDDAYDPFRRSWDLGPPPGQSYPPFQDGGAAVRTGGGAEMARFLLDQLRPFVAHRVRLNPTHQGLFGHSFGGLFALWLMFTQPRAFSHWIAASPAITWENSFVLAHQARFDPGEGPIFVHLSAGAWEGDQLAPFQETAEDATERRAERAKTRTIAAARQMAAELNRVPGVTVDYETYQGETHMSVLPVAVNRAIQKVFALS